MLGGHHHETRRFRWTRRVWSPGAGGVCRAPREAAALTSWQSVRFATSGLRLGRVLLGVLDVVVSLLDIGTGLLMGGGGAEGRLLDSGDHPLAPQGLVTQRRGQGDHVTVNLDSRAVEAADDANPVARYQALLGTALLLLLHRTLPAANEPHHQEHPDKHDPDEIRRHGGLFRFD